MQLTIGSTFVVGSGDVRFGLPVAAASGEGDQLGSALLLDAGTRFYAGVSFVPDGANYANTYADQAVVNFTTPFVPATGDVYRLDFDYVAAP